MANEHTNRDLEQGVMELQDDAKELGCHQIAQELKELKQSM